MAKTEVAKIKTTHMESGHVSFYADRTILLEKN